MTTMTKPRPTRGTEDRFRERRRAVVQEQARRRRRVTASVALVLVLGTVTYLATRSPLFDITHVRVEGVTGQQADVVRQVAAIRAGANLLGADLGAAETRVRRVPWVRTVDVRRQPPSTVLLDVTLRRPAVVVELSGAAWHVDRFGVVMGGGRVEGLPVMVARDAVLPGPGQRVSDAAVRNALAVLRRLPPRLAAAVTRYDASSDRGLRLRVRSEAAVDVGGRDGVWVRFGLAERVREKARVIRALLGQVQRQALTGGTEHELLPIAELDVRAPDNPVLIPAG